MANKSLTHNLVERLGEATTGKLNTIARDGNAIIDRFTIETREWRKGWTNRRGFGLATVILLATLLLAACAEARAEGEAVAQSLNPFAIRSVSEDGIEVLWRGFSKGHQPGDPSRFKVQLTNNHATPWDGRYCLILMDQLDVVAPLEQQDFRLERDGAQTADLEVLFPDGLEKDFYALALVVHRPGGELTQFVHIEMNGNHSTSTTLPTEASQAALEACPRPE